ncbi:MAG: DUF6250 domain-containing protein [Akkermansiaceae bacterium]
MLSERTSRFLVVILLAFLCLESTRASTTPVVLGKGTGLFEIGPEVVSDNFENLDNWELQIQPGDNAPEPSVKVKDNTLDCYLPGRGCTIWFRQMLKTGVSISYEVLCPTPRDPVKNLLPRDINNFWMAQDPGGKLFDSNRFTGSFGTYHKMHGYYASTGGGKNTTTTRSCKETIIVDENRLNRQRVAEAVADHHTIVVVVESRTHNRAVSRDPVASIVHDPDFPETRSIILQLDGSIAGNEQWNADRSTQRTSPADHDGTIVTKGSACHQQGINREGHILNGKLPAIVDLHVGDGNRNADIHRRSTDIADEGKTIERIWIRNGKRGNRRG